MRDYQHINRYLDILQQDIYRQPPDDGHQEAINSAINQWLPEIYQDAKNAPLQILDVGCAQGQAIPELSRFGDVEGVTLGEDADIARTKGYTVHTADMSFLPFEDNKFDLIFARHVIEHSPMPLLTLMEWHRVSRNFLLLIFPAYAHYKAQGDNHYSVLLAPQWEFLVERAGWEIIWEDRTHELKTPFETRWMCQKIVNERYTE